MTIRENFKYNIEVAVRNSYKASDMTEVLFNLRVGSFTVGQILDFASKLKEGEKLAITTRCEYRTPEADKTGTCNHYGGNYCSKFDKEFNQVVEVLNG